jgi:hypothetical protein
MDNDLRNVYARELGLSVTHNADDEWAYDNRDRNKIADMCHFYLSRRVDNDRADYLLPLCILLSVEIAIQSNDLTQNEEALAVEVVKMAMNFPIDSYYLYKVIDPTPSEEEIISHWFLKWIPGWTRSPSPWP